MSEKKLNRIDIKDLDKFRKILPLDSKAVLKYEPDELKELGTYFEIRPMTRDEKRRYLTLVDMIGKYTAANTINLKEKGIEATYIDTSEEEEELQKIIYDCTEKWVRFPTQSGVIVDRSEENWFQYIPDWLKSRISNKLSDISGLGNVEDQVLGY